MSTSLSIDQDLVDEVMRVGNFTTKKEAVNAALREFIKRRRHLEIIELFGRFDPDKDYGY